jgi:hypothetical protein
LFCFSLFWLSSHNCYQRWIWERLIISISLLFSLSLFLFEFLGIPVKLHEKHNLYVPELIFGHLLTGSNFDDTEEKVTGGRNGLGAKLANIYSLEFTVETASGITIFDLKKEL